MKTLLTAITLLVSSNLMAATTLICNDQNSHAVYVLTLNDTARQMNFAPLLKDNSILSTGPAKLKYNEGESNAFYTLYEGRNENNDTVIIELKNGTVAIGNTAEALVYYAKSNSPILNNKSIFLCEVR